MPQKENDLNKPVPLPYDPTRIKKDNAEYERDLAKVYAERKYKVRPGMKGFNPDSADGQRQLRELRLKRSGTARGRRRG